MFVVRNRWHNVTETLLHFYDLRTMMVHSAPLMEGWQQKAAFVIQLRPETDIEAGRFEGKVEHVTSCRATRFQSVDELLLFIATVLDEVKTRDQH
jgi:hypothetical protein